MNTGGLPHPAHRELTASPTPAALITGASSGIGQAITMELAGRGYRVMLVGRDQARLQAVASAARQAGSPDSRVMAADLTDGDGLVAVIDALTNVDVLVNAAGVSTDRPFPYADLHREKEMFDTNVGAVVSLSHAAAHIMADRGAGTILNIGSTAAVWSHGTYAGSKAYVHMMTDALRAFGAGRGVSVTLAVPGFTRTELHATAGVDSSRVAHWLWLTSDQVAREAVRAALAGRPVCVPGRRYRVLLTVASLLPRAGRQRLLRRIAPLGPLPADGNEQRSAR